MNTKDLELLKQRLQEKHASILLGAGFSYGAQNAGGNPLLLGGKLADQLYSHFYEQYPPVGKDTTYIETVKKFKSLKELCTILRSENRAEIRDRFLANQFTGCKSVGMQHHTKIKSYPWHTIFSLNIDDLVENIFSNSQTPLCVWNYTNNGQREDGHQTLIKLHGDVACIEDGFVFDDEEYRNFTAESNCLLIEFAHDFTTRDMVILGTEFQEEDISYILDLYKSAGYQTNGIHYFFVSPRLNSVVLMNTIESTSNFHWIDMDTESFLAYLSKEVVFPENSRNLLKECGTVFLDECRHQENYISQLYSGMPPQYNDFFFDWDIRYPGLCNTVNSIISSTIPATILTLYGKPYCGKTTVAKRCMVDFMESGFVSAELTRLDFQTQSALELYLSILPKDAKVALLIENAAYQYERIVQIAERCSGNIQKLVLITTDTSENHNTRSYQLANLPSSIIWVHKEISEQITDCYAGSIFYSLCIKKRLSNYLKYCNNKKPATYSKNMFRICDEIIKTDDVIDALYFSSEGRYFRDYYTNWIEQHKKDFYLDYLSVLNLLSKLGISKIPLTVLGKLIPSKTPKFSAEKFLKSFPDLLHVEHGYVKLLRSRIIGAVLHSSHSLTKSALYTLVRYTLGLFQEGDDSEACEMFQKALRIKRLRNHSLLSYEEMNDLFISLEKYCSNISYFWVQYGLIAQATKDYEGANNHFLYAKRVRNNSYQVAHALAKNRMEFGLFELKNGALSADEKFGQGCQEMETLISDPRYDRAFRYSVHSYAALLMKYYDAKRDVIPHEKCHMLNSCFKILILGQIDEETKNIIQQFVRYCYRHEMSEFCAGLEDIDSIIPYTCDDENDVEIDLINVEMEAVLL